MKYYNICYKFFILIALLFLSYPVSTMAASSSVSISNNATGSNSSVNITNEVNVSNNTGDNTSDSKTDIRIETNGQVQEYHGTGNEDVYIKSENGSNWVKITNKSNHENEKEIPEPPEPSPKSTPSAAIKENKIMVTGIEGILNFIRLKFEFFRNLLRI